MSSTTEPSQPSNAGNTNPLATTSSLRLLLRARRGDRAAREALAARYFPWLRRWARGRLPYWARDGVDTSDLVQDTLLQTFKRIAKFEPQRDGALRAYLRLAVDNRTEPMASDRRVIRRNAGRKTPTRRPRAPRRSLVETALQRSLEQAERRVAVLTRELRDANTALRVVLDNVEKSNEARNEQMLQEINTLVIPHVAKLSRLVEGDSAAAEYASLIETNLKTLTSSLSSRMATVFQTMTPSEAGRASGDARHDYEGHRQHAVAGAEHGRLSPQQHPPQARPGAGREPARVSTFDPLSGCAGPAAGSRYGKGPRERPAGIAINRGRNPPLNPAIFWHTHRLGNLVGFFHCLLRSRNFLSSPTVRDVDPAA